MNITWYDNALDADSDAPEWFDIDRIYCFDWDAFSDADWQCLADVYSQLPEVRPPSPESCPRWYSGKDDPGNGYLTASVEPPGLQVFGVLREPELSEWHNEFIKRISGLPFRILE